MTFTLEDKRDKLRSQLVYELTHAEPAKKQADKSTGGLNPKRSRFLKNPKNRKDPEEKREYDYKWL
jgi:hypothetical protein